MTLIWFKDLIAGPAHPPRKLESKNCCALKSVIHRIGSVLTVGFPECVTSVCGTPEEIFHFEVSQVQFFGP